MLSKFWFAFLLISSLGTTGFAQNSVEIPMGWLFPPKNAELEFDYLKTYDKEPEKEGGLASDTFPQSTTTYVYAEIEFKNLLYKIRDQEYEFTFKYFLENGKRLGEYTTLYTFEKDWSVAYYSDSWGWSTPGKWPLGTHRVEVWLNGNKFAVKRFTIVNK